MLENTAGRMCLNCREGRGGGGGGGGGGKAPPAQQRRNAARRVKAALLVLPRVDDVDDIRDRHGRLRDVRGEDDLCLKYSVSRNIPVQNGPSLGIFQYKLFSQ
jgi:hypothetical protein